jgi:hypothetical protein
MITLEVVLAHSKISPYIYIYKELIKLNFEQFNKKHYQCLKFLTDLLYKMYDMVNLTMYHKC